MADDGAIMFQDRPESSVAAAFDGTLVALGHSVSKTATDLEVQIRSSPRGTCFRVEVPKAFALSWARVLARATGRAVRVFTASVLDGDDGFDCALDDLLVATDGTTREGAWAADMTREYGEDWGQICDGKPQLAVAALLDNAAETVIGGGAAMRAFYISRSPSLGTPRLDEIAKQARLADRAQLTTVMGRECVRITSAGATVTSFVTKDETEALVRALGSLLRRS